MAFVIGTVLLFLVTLLWIAFSFSCSHKWKETSNREVQKGRDTYKVTLYHCEKCGNPKEERTKL